MKPTKSFLLAKLALVFGTLIRADVEPAPSQVVFNGLSIHTSAETICEPDQPSQPDQPASFNGQHIYRVHFDDDMNGNRQAAFNVTIWPKNKRTVGSKTWYENFWGHMEKYKVGEGWPLTSERGDIDASAPFLWPAT